MAANKIVVFLSHIHEEAYLAKAVSRLIDTAFLGLADVFMSSDPTGVAYGQRWLDEITENLKVCHVELILCSPTSIERPWINFEAGAGWVRGIPVIPICHSGLDRAELPIPLRLLQAANASDPQDVRGAISTIAKALNARDPVVDISPFLSEVKSLEFDLTFGNAFVTARSQGVTLLSRLNPAYATAFTSGIPFQAEVTETQIDALERALEFLMTQRMMSMSRIGTTSITPSGTFYGIRFSFSDSYREALQRVSSSSRS